MTGSRPGLLWAAGANGAAWIVAAGIGLLLLLRVMPEPIRASARLYEKSEWMAMVPPLLFIGGANSLIGRGDVLVLGALGTSRDVALYTVATRGAEFVLFMHDAVALVGTSLFASIYASGDRDELQRFTGLATKMILWASLPVYSALFLFAPRFLGLYGAEFIEAAGVMRLLLTTFFLSSLGGFVHLMLYMTGHQRDVGIVMGISGACNVGLCFLLIPVWGKMGAAVASGTSLVLLRGVLVLALYKRVGIVSLPFCFRGRS